MYSRGKGKHQKQKEDKEMTKMELARKQAQHIAEATGDQNIERIAKVLYKGMTTRELEKAIAHWENK